MMLAHPIVVGIVVKIPILKQPSDVRSVSAGTVMVNDVPVIAIELALTLLQLQLHAI